MVGYLLDTNTISGFIAAKYDSEIMQIISKEIDSSAKISVISQIELLSWKTDRNIEELIEEFTNSATIIGLNSDIISKCVDLRRKHKIKPQML